MSQARPPQRDPRAAGRVEAGGAESGRGESRVDAMLLAVRGGELEQSFALSGMPRVREYAREAGAKATLSVRFRNLDGRVLIDGEVKAELQMRCQRCLQPVVVAVDDEFNVVLVGSEGELDKLSPEQDAIVAEAERLDLRWLTEEQLLLAAPLVPAHASLADCGKIDAIGNASGGRSDQADDEVIESTAPVAETQRPFADLREMLKKR